MRRCRSLQKAPPGGRALPNLQKAQAAGGSPRRRSRRSPAPRRGAGRRTSGPAGLPSDLLAPRNRKTPCVSCRFLLYCIKFDTPTGGKGGQPHGRSRSQNDRRSYCKAADILCGAAAAGQPVPAALQYRRRADRRQPAGQQRPGSGHRHRHVGFSAGGLFRRYIDGCRRSGLPLFRFAGDRKDARRHPYQYCLRPGGGGIPDRGGDAVYPADAALDGYPGGGYAAGGRLHPHLFCRQRGAGNVQPVPGHYAGGGRQPPPAVLPRHLLGHQRGAGYPADRGPRHGGGGRGAGHHPFAVCQRGAVPAASDGHPQRIPGQMAGGAL